MSHFCLIPTLKEFKKNRPTFAKVTVKIKVAQFFLTRIVYIKRRVFTMIFPIFEKLWRDFGTMTYSPTIFYSNILTVYSVSQKNPPCGFLRFFPKRLGIFNQFFYNFLRFYLR